MSASIRDRLIEHVSIETLKPFPQNARTHSKKQINQIAQSMRSFGWTVPILIDADDQIIAGHGRLEAARQLGLANVPIIRIDDLSPDQVRALRIGDNRLAENASWDFDLLKVELEELIAVAPDFEVTDIGFDMGEIDAILTAPDELARPETIADKDLEGPPIAQSGDLFGCGQHRLLCGDAKSYGDLQQLMAGERAVMVISDPPYNIGIGGFASSSDRAREFHEASGEMTDAQYAAFLDICLANLAGAIVDGALVYLFIDWRHIDQMMRAGRLALGPHLTTAVWDKGAGGRGGIYKSGHELCCLFKFGSASHTNNVQLGRHGRNRTNIWRYPGLAAFGKGRKRALSMHPTVKPVAMIADAILDASNRGDIVLDPFAGSGTILIAAHRTGRTAYAMEIDPAYCDVALRRFRSETGVDPIHAQTGLTLSALERDAAAAVPVTTGQEGTS